MDFMDKETISNKDELKMKYMGLIYHLSVLRPYERSPASPSPGTMYPF